MSSQLVTVRGAVAAVLNAAPSGTFSKTFTAVVKYIPLVKLEEIGEAVAVTVLAKDYDRVLVTRGGRHTKEINVDIGVQKRLKATTDFADPARLSEIDGLMQLVEELADWFVPKQLGATGFYYRRSTIPSPIYEPSVMRTDHVFLSRVTVNFYKP